MTPRDERQAEVQAWLDTLSIVERHRVMRVLNSGEWSLDMLYHEYDVEWLNELLNWYS
jgi:hypothetical protein